MQRHHARDARQQIFELGRMECRIADLIQNTIERFRLGKKLLRGDEWEISCKYLVVGCRNAGDQRDVVMAREFRHQLGTVVGDAAFLGW